VVPYVVMDTPPDILIELMKSSRAQSEARRAKNSAEVYEQSWTDRPKELIGRFSDALAGPEFSLIAELKTHSPSEGAIHPDRGVVETIADYDWGGAAAMSVLVEESPRGDGEALTLERIRFHRL
jgi:indole-3-glycerol phosphate synthase